MQGLCLTWRYFSFANTMGFFPPIRTILFQSKTHNWPLFKLKKTLAKKSIERDEFWTAAVAIKAKLWLLWIWVSLLCLQSLVSCVMNTNVLSLQVITSQTHCRCSNLLMRFLFLHLLFLKHYQGTFMGYSLTNKSAVIGSVQTCVIWKNLKKWNVKKQGWDTTWPFHNEGLNVNLQPENLMNRFSKSSEAENSINNSPVFWGSIAGQQTDEGAEI